MSLAEERNLGKDCYIYMCKVWMAVPHAVNRFLSIINNFQIIMNKNVVTKQL